MENIKKPIYSIISFGLVLITFVITVLWVNNSNLLSEWYFYIIWISSIIIGVTTYYNSKKREIPKLIKTILLVITIFSTILLLGTVAIYFITSSMP